MDYTITATLKQILPALSGENKTGPWRKQQALIEETNAKGFKTDLMVVFWNERIDLLEQIAEGEERTFHFNVKSRKNRESWFTEVSVWKVTNEK